MCLPFPLQHQEQIQKERTLISGSIAFGLFCELKNMMTTNTHLMWSKNRSKGKDFDSGLCALTTTGKTYSHQFTKAGDFPYFCELHLAMIGKVTVYLFC
jgi:hypothetical protein